MIFEELEQMADEVDMTLPQLCRAADVEWRTVRAWKKCDPKTLILLRRLRDKYAELK
jgi:uncharacterized protein YjaG (DUF416 family)